MEMIPTITVEEDLDNNFEESNDKLSKLSETNWKEYLDAQNYNRDPEKMCEECIADQLKKYGSQVIPCTGLNSAKNNAGEAAFNKLFFNSSEEEIKEMDAIYDPYTYMELYLDYGIKSNKPIEDRWYQKLISKCSAKGKVIRIGRRSGKTYMMALMMVHEMLLNPGYRVLLVSPYAVQTAEVIKTFKDLCARLPEDPIKKAKQTPVHEIEFHNGSILMGFTAATNADSVRGQTADRIVLDECLSGDTKILMADGSEKEIKNISKGDYIMSEEEGKYIPGFVSNHKMTGIKETFTYTFEDGYQLVATPNHPVFTSEGVVEIDKANDIRVSSLSNTYKKIVSKEFNSIQEVYNITVLKYHNFVANGCLTHNCDDIPEAAITSVMAIRMSVPDVKVWRSGTPKGEVNLYKAEQNPQNKCFHFPSYVIPHYNDALDADLRHDVGDGIGYIQEVLALCGVSSNTVFQSMFISRAQNKILKVTAKDVLQDRSRFIVFIGVDWNHDQVGSRLIVCAYDKINPQFHIIDKEKVEVEGFTQHAAVEKIIQLNRKYNCDHVFCDLGMGTAQIASLKKFALAQVGIVPKGHPDLKLLDVTPVDFNSVTTIQDPVTGEEYKTPTKQLVVQSAVEVFEKDYITLDKDEDKDIINQLKNYVEKSRNKGRIVYGYISKKIGDHDLDALMIGLFGMKRLYSSLFVGEATQALMKFVNTSETEEEAQDDYDILGPSFGRSKLRSYSKSTIKDNYQAPNRYRRTVMTKHGRATF